MSITADGRSKLILLARSAVRAEVTRTSIAGAQDLSGILGEKRGCFVTLTNRGHLRGCIGTFQPDKPLGEMIVEMGRAAAHDPRFVTNPITPPELDQLTIEVSVLSELVETSEPEKLEIGKHGIYIVAPSGSGCFLPEVATDMHWSVEEFLSHCCQSKAGLHTDAWRDPGTKVYLFTSEQFDR